MKENYKNFIQIFTKRKSILTQSIILICMTFFLFNKHSVNASEITQEQAENINNQETNTSIKNNDIKTENVQKKGIKTNTQSTLTEPQNENPKVDNYQNHYPLTNNNQGVQEVVKNNNTLDNNEVIKDTEDIHESATNSKNIAQVKNPESKTTQQMSSPNQQTLYNAQVKSSQTDNETLAIQKQQQLNTNRLKNIKGNSTYKNTYYDKKYEGILSIETDRINYKPGDTVKIYTEHNRNFTKPTYSEAILYSHRSSGWYIDDPPYRFDKTSLVGRTTSFYKKANGNWESIITIQLPEKMVDDAFDITVNSWNDIESEYTRSYSNSNGLLIKVLNNNTSDLGEYRVEAFDESTKPKQEFNGPKIIKYYTDKKIYNPNDTVKMTIEMQDKNDIAYVQAKLNTLEPDVYKDGSQKYIPMTFANFTRDIKQMSNGNWQAIIEFKIPSYIKTGDIILDDIVASDKLGNDNELDYDFDKKLFKVERTENIASFTVDTIADFSKEIRGKATSNMMIYAYVNNKQIGKAKVTDGKYFMSIPKQKAGTNIQIFTINKYNKKSKIVTKKVIDRTAPKTPTISKLTTKSKVVSGKGEKNSIVYIYRGSTKIGQATVDTKGNYKLNIKPQKKGTKLTIYSVDKAKNKSKKLYVKVS
ncbi:Ig-like domain-containing protein [Staphylococcus cohnii]|uniref:Ig-like domain-containing protein n=1 Tax=Staphylococcus cohnii TaxID=29382 RepID=UPI0025513281|nr:Ig-like domain-containing protein [Staphylococcus cohnii]WIL69778.1 Ig-like domain-containing protein [Staphylococcus cohnii]